MAKGLSDDPAISSEILQNHPLHQDDDASGLEDLFQRQGTHDHTNDKLSLASRVHDRSSIIKPTIVTQRAA